MAGQIEEDVSQSVVSDATEESQSPPFSGGWYFPRDLIERYSPSRADGISLSKENQLRKSFCTFIQNLGMKLKLPQNSIATAVVFCHRFYLRQSHAKNDRFTIATACIFLAGKVEETPKLLQNVVFASYEMRNKKDPTAIEKFKSSKEVYEKEKDLILTAESLVLTTLDFDLNISHPYKFLVVAIKKLKAGQNSLAQVAWNFLNDGLRTTLCLQYNPRHVAAGAIYLAAKFLKLKLPNDRDVVWWQEFDITARQLEDVSNQMLELYEQHPNQKSPGPSSSDISMVSGAATPSKPQNLSTNCDGDICTDDAEKTPCTGVKRPNIEVNLSSEVNSQNDNPSEQQYYENQLKCGQGQECKRFCSDNSKNQTVLSSSVF